ncbi:UNVERIFIED_CONTAM: hypothetical protein NCL1_20161 [Trichonephila clavipes]
MEEIEVKEQYESIDINDDGPNNHRKVTWSFTTLSAQRSIYRSPLISAANYGKWIQLHNYSIYAI